MSNTNLLASKLVASIHIDKETQNGSRLLSIELTEATRRALTVHVKPGKQKP